MIKCDFDEGALRSWVSCWRIRNGMSEYQKSRPLYLMYPKKYARRQALLKLRFMRLHLDGATIWP